MTSPKITDAHVKRFQDALAKPRWLNNWASADAVRAGLEAALSEPVEPGYSKEKMALHDPCWDWLKENVFANKPWDDVKLTYKLADFILSLKSEQEGPSGTPYGVKEEPIATAAVGGDRRKVVPSRIELGGTWHYFWKSERWSAWLTDRRKPDRTPSTDTDATRPKPREAQHFHRRYSDSIYGPPTRYETHAHQRSTDIQGGSPHG